MAVLCVPDSWSNWNLEFLFFDERGKPEHPEKNLSPQRREPITKSTHIWLGHRDLNPGHIGGRRVRSLLPHPCSPPLGRARLRPSHALTFFIFNCLQINVVDGLFFKPFSRFLEKNLRKQRALERHVS